MLLVITLEAKSSDSKQGLPSELFLVLSTVVSRIMDSAFCISNDNYFLFSLLTAFISFFDL